jgi:hypothetical protein
MGPGVCVIFYRWLFLNGVDEGPNHVVHEDALGLGCVLLPLPLVLLLSCHLAPPVAKLFPVLDLLGVLANFFLFSLDLSPFCRFSFFLFVFSCCCDFFARASTA